MIRFEPIPELSSLLMSARMARFPYPEVADAVTAVDKRTKTPSSDTAAWRAVYEDVLAELIPQILDAQRRLEGDRKTVASARGDRSAAATPSAVQAASTALQSESNHWQGRLQQQEGELLSKVEPAVRNLDVVSESDQETGELVFLFNKSQTSLFWGWLAEVERTWSANNGRLAALRGQEAVGPLLPEGAFEVRATELRAPSWQPPELHGERIPEPGFFQLLGATYRTIMTSVTAVSGLGFFLSRTDLVERTCCQGHSDRVGLGLPRRHRVRDRHDPQGTPPKHGPPPCPRQGRASARGDRPGEDAPFDRGDGPEGTGRSPLEHGIGPTEEGARRESRGPRNCPVASPLDRRSHAG